MELIILMQKSVFPKWDLQPSSLKKILKERLQNYFNDTVETKLNITETICVDRRPRGFPEQIEKIKNGQNSRPVIVLSGACEGTPDKTAIRQVQENPHQWVFFYADYTRKGEHRRALRIGTDGEIVISDDENLTEITKNTVLYPVYSESIYGTVSRCKSKTKNPVKIPEETIFLNAFEVSCIKNWSCDSWICAEHPSVKDLRNKVGIIYLQEKQIRCRLIDRPEDETDKKSFDELRGLCKELGIPVKTEPSEKTRFFINHCTNWALRIIETPFDPAVWNSVIRMITAGCRISKLSTMPSEENEAVRDAIFARYEYMCKKTRNLARESDSEIWLPIQEKWQHEMSENVFRKMTAILPGRFMRTNPDSNESYDTVVISYGIRCSDNFPDRADYIRAHKKDFIRAGWAGMEYVFAKNQNRKRAVPLPFLAPVSLRFFAHADLLEITFKLKNKLCTGTAGRKTEKTEE